MSQRFVSAVMGEHFMQVAEKELDLLVIVDNEIQARTPMLLCSVTGFDASGRIDDLAAETSKTLTSIAIGSAEGFSEAEKAINSAAKSGRFVQFYHSNLCTILFQESFQIGFPVTWITVPSHLLVSLRFR